jgi:MFS family permease
MRPVGAILFGMMADRFGRRLPLMLNIVFFSLVEVLSGLSPNCTISGRADGNSQLARPYVFRLMELRNIVKRAGV